MLRMKAMKIQLVDWYSADVKIVDPEEEEEEGESDKYKPKTYPPLDYQITIFGRETGNKSVAVTIIGFKPFFYVKMPVNWNSDIAMEFIDCIKSKMGRICESGFSEEPRIVEKKDFNGFKNEKNFSFVLFTFNNRKCMNICKKQFQRYVQGETETDWRVEAKELSLPPMFRKPTIYSMYESTIDPILRCIHQQELFPSGWVTIDDYSTQYDSELTCDIHITTHFENVHKDNNPEIGKIRICAFDIECNSSHFDFPQAEKTYQKFGRDLQAVLQKSEFYDFEDEAKREILSYIFSYVFQNEKNKDEIDTEFLDEVKISLSDIGYVFTKQRTKPAAKRITKVTDLLLKILKLANPEFGVRDRSEFNNNLITKISQICDLNFPEVEGDSVVQIASSIIDYGDDTCIKKQIITLGECADILDDTIEVVKCFSEEELLLEWRKMIIKMDPDIITGYNIYGFDVPFLYDRSVELGIHSIFSKLGRFRDRECELKTKRLSSAALGDNIWRELQITGRIQVDIMRVVQRDYNLSSWSLDYVSSYFMNGKIMNLEPVIGSKKQYVIRTNNTNGIQDNSYVNIMINNGITTDLYGDHTKFKVIQYTQDSLVIEGSLNLDEIPFTEHACTWCHAKDDIEYNDIFRAWSKDLIETPDVLAMRSRCARYCVRDAVLCLDLMKKLDIIANNIGMANVCSVPLSWIFSRGQGVKTLSLVSKQCQKEGFVLPVLFQGDDPEYEGAVVLQPKPGIYLDEAIVTLDYASLYPSCIISENMSHDSIVLDDEWKGDEGKKRLEDLGYGCVDIEWDVYKTKGNKKVKVRKETSRFVQFPDNKKGVIPRILDHLLTARRNTRRKIKFKTLTLKDDTKISGIVKTNDNSYTVYDEYKKEHTVAKEDVESVTTTFNSFQQGVMDGLQKAYKITANSIYGQMGAKTSPVKMIAIAACTTATGRKLLMTAKDFIHDNYQNTTVSLPDRDVFIKDSDTVYGDSVLPDTPVLVKHNNVVRTIRIDELSKLLNPDTEWYKWHDTKQQIEQFTNNNVFVWTDKGFTRIKRVIRHTSPTPRKIIRVVTHTGIVDVTEDHSLLDMEGVKVKPSKVNIGDQLLHSSMKHIDFDGGDDKSWIIVNEEEAWLMGLFFGDGNACRSNSSSGIKYTWKISNSNLDILDRARTIMEKIGMNPKIYDTMESSGVYNIHPRGKVEELSQKYRTLFYNSKKEKIVPACILNASMSVIKSFFDGYYSADGNKDVKGYCRFDNKGKEGTMGLYIIASRLGYNVSINTRQDKPDIYRCTCTHSVQMKNPFAIKKKYILHDMYDGYVYDISTENHHFHVGPGRLVVSNTDSVFVNFNMYDKKGGTKLEGKELLKAAIDIGVEAGKQITKTLKAPHDLEYEKTFQPFILLSKKRYVGNKYEFDLDKYKQTSMGIVLKRRDNAKIVKYIYGGAIEIIMKERNLQKAIDFTKNAVYKLINGKFNMDYLIITKSLRSFYKNPLQIAHKVLADRMGERDPGNKPKSNDRIPYAYIVKKSKKKERLLQGDRIEHPDFILKNDLKIDYRHYVTNQISKPICQVFALELEKLPHFRETINLKKRIREWNTAPEEDKKKKYEFMRKEREKITHSLLFSEYVSNITNEMNNQNDIRNFFTISTTNFK